MASKTPVKKGTRTHSDVEPETPSPSITQQPKSSRLSVEENVVASNPFVDTFAEKDMMDLIKEQIQSSFRQILQEEIERGNAELLIKLNGSSD